MIKHRCGDKHSTTVPLSLDQTLRRSSLLATVMITNKTGISRVGVARGMIAGGL